MELSPGGEGSTLLAGAGMKLGVEGGAVWQRGCLFDN